MIRPCVLLRSNAKLMKQFPFRFVVIRAVFLCYVAGLMLETL